MEGEKGTITKYQRDYKEDVIPKHAGRTLYSRGDGALVVARVIAKAWSGWSWTWVDKCDIHVGGTSSPPESLHSDGPEENYHELTCTAPLGVKIAP